MYEEVNKFSKVLDVPIMDAVTDDERALMAEFLRLSEGDQKKVVELMKDQKRIERLEKKKAIKKAIKKAKKRGDVN